MRIAFVSTYPPDEGTLSNHTFHFISHLRQKPEVSDVLVLANHLPEGSTYPLPDEKPGMASLRVHPCWRYG
ncbi:MAG: glycosyl transferase family 1, partial [Chloroflexota bacterium]